MKKAKALRALSVVVLVSSLAASCGGGGGSSGGGIIPPPPPVSCVYTDADKATGYYAANVDELRNLLSTLGGDGKDDVIYVAAGTFAVTAPLVYEAKAPSEEKITIRGCGKSSTIFDGGRDQEGRLLGSQVFAFYKGVQPLTRDELLAQMDSDAVKRAPFPRVRFEDMTITNGMCAQKADGAQNDCLAGSPFDGGAAAFTQRFDVELVNVDVTENFGGRGSVVGGARHLVLKNVLSQNNNQVHFWIWGAVTVEDSSFIETKSLSDTQLAFSRGSGAVYLDPQDAPVLFKNSSITDMAGFIAFHKIGAVTENGPSKLTIEGSHFLRVSRCISSVLQSIDITEIVIDGSVFESGEGCYGQILSDYVAGGGYAPPKIQVTNTSFTGNKGTAASTIMMLQTECPSDFVSLSMDNVQMANNTADADRSLIDVTNNFQNVACNVEISNSTFTSNTPPTIKAGAVKYTNVDIDGVIFNN